MSCNETAIIDVPCASSKMDPDKGLVKDREYVLGNKWYSDLYLGLEAFERKAFLTGAKKVPFVLVKTRDELVQYFDIFKSCKTDSDLCKNLIESL